VPYKNAYQRWLAEQSKPKRKFKKIPREIFTSKQQPIVDRGNFSNQVGYDQGQAAKQLGAVKREEKRLKQERITQRKQANAVSEGKKGATYTFPDGTTKTSDQMDWREKSYVAGKSLENRGRLFPNDENFVDEWLNPASWFGSAAGHLGQSPYEARESNSNMPYVTGVGGVGLIGLGMKSLPKSRMSARMRLNQRNLNRGEYNTVQNGFANPFKRKQKSSTYNSEINWQKWNKEIPDNVPLLNEYHNIEKTAKANGTWMKNPDGSKFKGTPEQFVQQNSKNFKRAFGNSKVRDVNNNPQIVKHTTDTKNISQFDLKHLGMTDDGFHGKGIYGHPQTEGKFKNAFEYGDNKYNLYYNIENPIPHKYDNFYGRTGESAINGKRFKAEDLWKNKYDGVITRHKLVDGTPFPEYVTSPNNIKSAIGNNGMFDMTNPNIYRGLAPIGIAGATGYYMNNQLP
jgi:hypothetical protein